MMVIVIMMAPTDMMAMLMMMSMQCWLIELFRITQFEHISSIRNDDNHNMHHQSENGNRCITHHGLLLS